MNYPPLDFKYLLLDNYKKLGLNEEDAIVLLMLEQLINQGNKVVTADLLSLKMQYEAKKIDSILVSLLKRGYIVYDFEGYQMLTSLDPLKKKLYALLEKEIAENNANLVSAERAEALSRLYAYFEKRLSRTLSPVEMDFIQGWLSDGFSEDEIKGALDDAYIAGKRKIKSVDKALRSNRARADIAKEGYTGISESWNEDIEKTIEIAKTKWVKDSDDDE
ncbi:MAG: DnaD domain protein [Bacillota bacterium]|nr:DnaD domain protein [Bacillota bacterium]